MTNNPMPQLVDVTPADIKKWGDTRSAMIWHAPGFTHLLYSMLNKNENEYIAYFVADVPPEDPFHIPVAATDGSHMLINPVTYFKYNLQERVFVAGHEVIHAMCGHPELLQRLSVANKVVYPDGKVLKFDAGVMNRAMDYVVNDLLIESKIGQYNPAWLWDKTIGTYLDDVLTVYRRILPPDQGGQGKQGKQGQSGFDKLQKPGTTTGKDAQQATADRSQVEWDAAIAGAMHAAKVQGKLPSALERFFGKELEPEVSWQDLVLAFFQRKVGGGGYDWRKPDRRFIVRNIVTPARSGYGCGDIVCAVDTSGSIDDTILQRFYSEVGGMLEDLRPRRLLVLWCDAKVHRVDELDDASDLLALKQKKAPGGGGTDFRPVFDKITELGVSPDALIYLTDGDGTFPAKSPIYPVLWGDISGDKKKYPKWGDYVRVPV